MKTLSRLYNTNALRFNLKKESTQVEIHSLRHLNNVQQGPQPKKKKKKKVHRWKSIVYDIWTMCSRGHSRKKKECTRVEIHSLRHLNNVQQRPQPKKKKKVHRWKSIVYDIWTMCSRGHSRKKKECTRVEIHSLQHLNNVQQGPQQEWVGHSTEFCGMLHNNLSIGFLQLQDG